MWDRAKKASPEALAALNAANSMMSFEQRESVYDDKRDELTGECRLNYFFYLVKFETCCIRSKKSIPTICKGFWKNDMHVAKQFSHLTGSPALNAKVEANLITQIG